LIVLYREQWLKEKGLFLFFPLIVDSFVKEPIAGCGWFQSVVSHTTCLRRQASTVATSGQASKGVVVGFMGCGASEEADGPGALSVGYVPGRCLLRPCPGLDVWVKRPSPSCTSLPTRLEHGRGPTLWKRRSFSPQAPLLLMHTCELYYGKSRSCSCYLFCGPLSWPFGDRILGWNSVERW
jgi:hypothetical protein